MQTPDRTLCAAVRHKIHVKRLAKSAEYLKEAFRFQNKITSHLEAAQRILQRDSNITKATVTYFRKKVDPDAENEVIESEVTTDYAEHITEMAKFMLWPDCGCAAKE